MRETPAPCPRSMLWAIVCIAGSAAFLLAGYEFVRSIAQSLFIEAYGANRLPIVMALGPVGTLLVVYAYAWLLSRCGAKKAAILTCLAAGAVILVCYQAINAGSRIATGVLYVFREAYIVLLVEQVWSFINSTVGTAEGRRFNGPVCGAASLGAIGGGFLLHALAVRMGSAHLLLIAAASLVPTGLLAAMAYHWGGESRPSAEEAGGRQGHLGWRALVSDPTLRNLGLLIVVTQVVSTLLDLQLSRFVEQALPNADGRTQWLGRFYAYLNLGASISQFVLTPLLLHYARIRTVHMAMPVIHLILCVACVIRPSLLAAGAAYMAFKIMDYSVFRASKELLYIPLSFDARYRAKELIDAFGYRLAKGAASGLLAGVGGLIAIPVVSLPALAIGALAGWLPLAWKLTRSGRRREPRPAVASLEIKQG